MKLPILFLFFLFFFQADVGRTPICDASNLQSSSKNAVSMINEYAQAQKLAIEFLCDLDGPDHSRRCASGFA